MPTNTPDYIQSLTVGDKTYTFAQVTRIPGVEKLPVALTILVENILRNVTDETHARELVHRVIDAGVQGRAGDEVEFMPARVLFQDFTGVPVFVDFAAMREAVKRLGGDPKSINPQIPCDLVIDHSVIADKAGSSDALNANIAYEFERNHERYAFLKWAQKSFDNVRIVAPGQGICHQLNIEKFASVVMYETRSHDDEVSSAEAGTPRAPWAYFDTLVGTDSHTPTANGLGVLGWGVGGIEAEAASLGQAITTRVPRVVGLKLTGQLQPGIAAMDVALRIAELLRGVGVVGAFIECFGPGVSELSATQRACISNMSPEYGCTSTLFPIDEETINYLRLTNRDEDTINLVREYARAQGVWGTNPDRIYEQILTLDLSSITPTVAGPSRPHDAHALSEMPALIHELSRERKREDITCSVTIDGETYELTHGALAIAAVTSCTTATDPEMMISAGLLARNAAAAGLHAKPWVKTIFAPGSHATEEILRQSGLLASMEALGFYTCGFGCMSCIGNSGEILPEMKAISETLELTSVLSGNRNFEGRISPDVSQNYLCAPALVIAYGLVGRMDFDFEHESLGTDATGHEVYLRDILPSAADVHELFDAVVSQQLFDEASRDLFEGSPEWRALEVEPTDTFAWDENSTYVRHAPYFEGMMREVPGLAPIQNARVLAKLGDFITTDHISPAGAIALTSDAAAYLKERGVDPAHFNTYGSRRGNHEVMMRGTFANVKLTNELGEGKRGSWTKNFLTHEHETIFKAAMDYQAHEVPLVVIAGKMYGSGSSRDWAAKGPALLGVRAVFAESFERIHRSNLIGMGIVPLQFEEGQTAQTLGLTGSETFTIAPIDVSEGLPKERFVAVRAKRPDGTEIQFRALVRIDTPTEGQYLYHGGILPYVLRQLVK